MQDRWVNTGEQGAKRTSRGITRRSVVPSAVQDAWAKIPTPVKVGGAVAAGATAIAFAIGACGEGGAFVGSQATKAPTPEPTGVTCPLPKIVPIGNTDTSGATIASIAQSINNPSKPEAPTCAPEYQTNEAYAVNLWVNQKNLTGDDKTAFDAMVAGNQFVNGNEKFTKEGGYKSGYYDMSPQQAMIIFNNTKVQDGHFVGTIDFGFWKNEKPYVMRLNVDSKNVDGVTLVSDFMNLTTPDQWDNPGTIVTSSQDAEQQFEFFKNMVGQEVILGIGVPNFPGHPEAVNMMEMFRGSKAFEDWMKGVKGAQQPKFVIGPNASTTEIANSQSGAIAIPVYSPFVA